ncbi:hypothetical protein [Sorangium cellulosum]|uniref:hypothetical protein n=1 Tax=Sorangium cellulosum TaxID=56 RepID=UPI000CF421C4|nr:hypothetical protein [Sorangium cellulosum]
MIKQPGQNYSRVKLNLGDGFRPEEKWSGKRTFSYDRLGNVAKLTTESHGTREPHRGPYEVTMEYTLDAFGRLLSMKFPGPGAEVVTHGYDRGARMSNK